MALKFGTQKQSTPAAAEASPAGEVAKKPSFLKTGAAAAAAFNTAEAAAEEQKNFTPRFYIKKYNEPYKIMFLDGDLNSEGLLS